MDENKKKAIAALGVAGSAFLVAAVKSGQARKITHNWRQKMETNAVKRRVNKRLADLFATEGESEYFWQALREENAFLEIVTNQPQD